jgi:AmiR/NasT family two-component response regulator
VHPIVTSVLLAADPLPTTPDLLSDFGAAGLHAVGVVRCDNLVQAALRDAPDVVACWWPAVTEACFDALALLQRTAPQPVIVFTFDVQAEAARRALELGVAAWVVHGYAPARLRPLVQLAQARHAHERKLREALQDLNERFEERKLLDRAKGILMQARAVGEDEAFALLRAASMQGKQRLGQVAQQVIASARDADLVNRAGQLRMLSQRAVKLQALIVARTEVPAARLLLQQTLQRAQQQIERLQRGLSGDTYGDLLAPLHEAYGALKAALAAAGEAPQLAEADARAEALLQAADRLTVALEQAAPASTVQIVNTSGRQRMLSQRLAKQALLGALLGDDGARAAWPATVQAFEQALAQLQAAPLSTDEIRRLLAEAAHEWQRMLQGVHSVAGAAGRVAVAGASEALLELFEQLTLRYEHGMQLLIGDNPGAPRH